MESLVYFVKHILSIQIVSIVTDVCLNIYFASFGL